MGKVENQVAEVAGDQRFLITRGEIFELGGDDDSIRHQISEGRWRKIHAGVYQVDRRPTDWESALLGAVFACGPSALVCRRSALTLWGLDGIATEIVEVTVPYGSLPIPDGVVASSNPTTDDTCNNEGNPCNDCRANPSRLCLDLVRSHSG